ncbi:hypothetical protein IFM89_017395 [Coptis chinensis]|uniref:4-coumarate--CoA ligase n=1 Tax=Coptis chinensis TaxID=261450 RepID=A0A835LN73_9MAGN|nr:hypothetical protein IFM89_017395 [Coptis chinensis]
MACTSKHDYNFDLKSGFSSKTRIFHSLRPKVQLPPPNLPLSAAQHAISLLKTSSLPLSNTTALIDSVSGTRVSFTEFLKQAESLSVSLKTNFSLKKGDVAFILSPNILQVPILYISLLSLGVIVSPANPASTVSEVSRQVGLTNPVIAFAVASTASKIPSLRYGTVFLDSSEFKSMLVNGVDNRNEVMVNQSDTAAILYSSGTTGRVKGVELTHRNFIALVSGFHAIRPVEENPPHPVAIFTVPLFHVFGFFMCVRAVALGETVVLMEKFDFVGMLKAVESYKVNYMPVSPPLVVAMAKLDVVDKFDLSSLLTVGCGGAPLGKEVSKKFIARFPHVEIVQGYGMTETSGGATRMLGPDETKKHGSVGRLAENMEAKIVHPDTGEALGPGQRGELWMRGPIIMKGDEGVGERPMRVPPIVSPPIPQLPVVRPQGPQDPIFQPRLNPNGQNRGLPMQEAARALPRDRNFWEQPIPRNARQENRGRSPSPPSPSTDRSGSRADREPNRQAGYVGDDEATTSTMDSDGWLKTGDLCYIDSDGFLYIVDRLKELIKYKAYQVPPAELEHLLQSHPEIADVALIPYPDEEAGQIPMAFVVRKPGRNLSAAQVMEFVAKQACLLKTKRFILNAYLGFILSVIAY